jgi:hypothetical protein
LVAISGINYYKFNDLLFFLYLFCSYIKYKFYKRNKRKFHFVKSKKWKYQYLEVYDNTVNIKQIKEKPNFYLYHKNTTTVGVISLENIFMDD